MLYAGGVTLDEPVYGVIGDPLDFTLSPRLHNAALLACGLPGHYRQLRVPPQALPAAIQALRDVGRGGYNVTMPHKVAVIPLLDTLTPLARETGAVNTVYWQGDQLCGDNTDVGGFQACVGSFFPSGSECLLLGSGGAARAVALALRELGARAVYLVARNLDKATRLRAELLPGVPGHVVFWEDVTTLESLAPRCDWVVNATPVGADGFTSPLSARVLAAFPETAVVNDLIYGQFESLMLLAARGRGLKALNGLPMLMEQAALAFTRFTGQPAPRADMWRAVAHDDGSRWGLRQ